MVADDTALILVLPDDTADSLLRKAEQAGVRRVQLLVPDGVLGLQQQAQCDRLRTQAVRAGLELTVISSDPQTLRAARLSRIETMQVRNTHVVVPPPAAAPAAPPPANPYATHVLNREESRGAASSRVAADLSASDAAFLDALDDLDALPPPRAVGPAAEDEDFFAALESISADPDTRPAHPGATSKDDDFLDALDSLNDDEDTLRQPAPRRTEVPPAAPRRIRPEDIELSDAEKVRAKQTGRVTSVPPPRSSRTTTAPSSTDAPRRGSQLDDEFRQVAPPRQNRLVRAGLIIGLLLIIAIAANLILGSKATVIVAPPVRSAQIEPISNFPIPLTAPGGGSTGTAVLAEAIFSDVAVTVSGQIADGTMSPSGTARGTITLISLNPQPITLPAGSEFVAVKADGQDVPFVSAGDVVVPPSTTSDQGNQIVTTKGTASIEVVARSPGSASNVDANSIRRIVMPGGQTFNVGGALVVRHDPISGGSEDQVRIVKDSDVQRLLGDGLVKLDTQARQQIQGLASARSLQLETTTIFPRRAALEQLQDFEYTVSPAVGEMVDPANPTFTVMLQARYSALATPSGKLLTNQIGEVLTEQLRQANLLQPGDCKAPAITSWVWDSTRLTVNGQITPNTHDPACGPSLSAAALQQVRDAVRGKSRAEAEAALQSLVQQELISSYTLPTVDKLPSWDFQLRVESR